MTSPQTRPLKPNSKYRDMPLDEERRLFSLWRDHGDAKARDALVRAQQTMVRSVADNFHSLRMKFEERVQEGNVGLMIAMKNFDPERGIPFGAYARSYVRGAIYDACFCAKTILSINQTFIDLRNALRAEKKRRGLDMNERLNEKDCREIAHALGVELELARDVDAMDYSNISLNAFAFRQDGRTETLLETLPDSSVDVFRDLAEAQTSALRQAWFANALGILEEDERRVFSARLFNRTASWRLLGEELGVTPRRAEALHGFARRKIRRNLSIMAREARRATGETPLDIDLLMA